MADVNRQLKLQSRPKGLLAPGDLQLAETSLPAIQDGQALARVKYCSVDPTMRVWMAVDTYLEAVASGEVMRAAGLAEVVESRHKDFKKVDKVVGLTGLQDYCVIDGVDKRGSFRKIPPVPFLSDTAFLVVLGCTGITAYFWMMEIAKPQKGETLVVSAAAVPTRSISVQKAKVTASAL